MSINLVPPFILHEAGLVLTNISKIHVTDPKVADHSVYMPVQKLQILLSLYGTFSYFPSCARNNGDNVITPDGDSCGPHSDVYASNKKAMLEWEGEMIQSQPKRRRLLEDDDTATTSYVNARTDAIAQLSITIGETIFPKEYDESFITLSSIDATLPPESFIEILNERQAFSYFAMSIGSTNM